MLKKKDLDRQKSFKWIDDGWYADTWELVLEWDDKGCLLSSICEVSGERFPEAYIKDFNHLQEVYQRLMYYDLELKN